VAETNFVTVEKTVEAENQTRVWEPDAGCEPSSLQYIRGQKLWFGAPIRRWQVACRGLSALSHNVERDFLSLVEAMQPGPFHSADVDEHVLAAVIRLDEPEAFLAVEPLYGSLRHVTLLSSVCVSSPAFGATAVEVRALDKVVSPTHSARRGQVVRPKLDA
jgi:hypothetical protein